ncbi:hypothetical protein ACH5RR_015752 [Cinchona calisaya]|uniref:Uncharacterized protein n=1 Tax=Cinchona calisaya TaxID=153742 RepID=A0ABD2ZZF4_9GENT
MDNKLKFSQGSRERENLANNKEVVHTSNATGHIDGVAILTTGIVLSNVSITTKVTTLTPPRQLFHGPFEGKDELVLSRRSTTSLNSYDSVDDSLPIKLPIAILCLPQHGYGGKLSANFSIDTPDKVLDEFKVMKFPPLLLALLIC